LLQQEQKIGLQVGDLTAASVGFQGGAMAYIEDSSVELESWRSLNRKGQALLFVGLSKPKPGLSSPNSYWIQARVANESVGRAKGKT
jgi:hypothetical protein